MNEIAIHIFNLKYFYQNVKLIGMYVCPLCFCFQVSKETVAKFITLEQAAMLH